VLIYVSSVLLVKNIWIKNSPKSTTLSIEQGAIMTFHPT